MFLGFSEIKSLIWTIPMKLWMIENDYNLSWYQNPSKNTSKAIRYFTWLFLARSGKSMYFLFWTTLHKLLLHVGAVFIRKWFLAALLRTDRTKHTNLLKYLTVSVTLVKKLYNTITNGIKTLNLFRKFLNIEEIWSMNH